MQKPTIPAHIQAIADELVAQRRGWSGPLGMSMTSGPPEPDPAAAAAAAAAAEQARAAAAAAAAAGGGGPEEATDEQGRKLGFPKDTPTERMKEGERAAYWRHESRKQEAARRSWQDTFGGKTPEEVKQALDAAAAASMTEQERKIEEARQAGIQQGQQTGVATSAETAAMLLLETHLEHRLPDDADQDRRKILADSVNIKTAIGEDGKVDPVRVKAIADALAPSSGGKPGDRTSRTTSTDVGGGRRTSQSGTGVAAGRELYKEKRGGGAKNSDE